MTDLQSFLVAFGIVWGGIAAYVLWLDMRLRRLEKTRADR